MDIEDPSNSDDPLNPPAPATKPQPEEIDSTPDLSAFQANKEVTKIEDDHQDATEVSDTSEENFPSQSQRLIDFIEKRCQNLNESLRVKEKLKLKIFELEINNAYYKLWSSEANLLFKLNVVLKRRAEKLKQIKK